MDNHNNTDNDAEAKRVSRVENRKYEKAFIKYCYTLNENWLFAVNIISLLFVIAFWVRYLVILHPESLTDASVSLASMIAEWTVLPHLVLFSIALVFSYVAWFWKIDWCALSAGLLYIVAFAMLPSWGFDVAFQAIVCCVYYGGRVSKKR